MSLEEKFHKVFDDVSCLKTAPTRAEQKPLYGLYKQGCGLVLPKDRPSSINFWAAGKYAAWEEVKDVPAEEAQKRYIALGEELIAKYGIDTEKLELLKQKKAEAEAKKKETGETKEGEWEDEN